jgi:hypothetical protein
VPVYSTRFVLGAMPAPLTYSPPAGKVAVIKCVIVVNTSAGTKLASADIGGVYVWLGSIPAASALQAAGLMVVVNAGEIFKLGGDATMHGQASGYLLDKLP